MIYFISFTHADTCKQILFYNTDTNINNYKYLKIEFDKFFEKIGNYSFQPIIDKNIFENQLKEKKYCMLITSSWYFNNIKDKLTLCPVLTAHRKGIEIQKIILLKKTTPGDEGKKLDLHKGKFASSMSKEYTKELLNKILIDYKCNNNYNVLCVPKAIDALLSVGLGMSRYALSTYHSFNILSKINPPLFNKLTCIGRNVDSPLMICTFFCQQKDQQLLNAFVNIDKIPEGINAIKMLGIDGFKYYRRNTVSP